MIYILSGIYNNETLLKSTAFKQNLLHYIVQSFFRLHLSKDSFPKKLNRSQINKTSRINQTDKKQCWGEWAVGKQVLVLIFLTFSRATEAPLRNVRVLGSVKASVVL